MFFTADTEEARNKMKNLEDGLEWLLDRLQKLDRWVFCTKRFLFGNGDVYMHRANIVDDHRVALLLSYEKLATKPEDTPHVELIFDNVQGINSLIGQLQLLKIDMEAKIPKEKPATEDREI